MRTSTVWMFVTVLALVVTSTAQAQQVVYNDGPINGTVDAWTINFGFSVSDTFTVSSSGPSTLNELTFGAWLFPGDTLESVEVSMTPYHGNMTYFDGIVNFSASGCSMNQYGFNVCTETGFFNGPTLQDGTYWLHLQNALVSSGDPVYWDENSGVGCTSPGCPSQAYQIEPVPPESFTLYGSSAASVPEPSSVLLLGTGLLGVGSAISRKRMRR